MASAIATRQNAARNGAIASMNQALREQFDKIAANVDKATKTNVLFYYDLGLDVAAVRDDESRYGDGAVEKIAAGLGINKSTVYKSVRITETWTQKEYKALAERRTCNGRPITVSLIVMLVSLPTDQIPKMVEKIFAHDFTVEALTAEIRKLTEAGSSATGKAPRSITGGLSQMGTMSAKMIEKLSTDWPASLFDPLNEIEPESISDDLIKKVDQGSKDLHKLAKEAEAKASKLDKVKSSLSEALKKQQERAKAAASKDKDKEKDKKPAAKPETKTNGSNLKPRVRRPVPA